jgi:hypothetical protein
MYLGEMSTSLADQEFADAFEACTLAKENFKHRDHVRLAWFYLKTSAHYEEALDKVRGGIKKFAKAHGQTGLYHETITCLFMHYIAKAMSSTSQGASFEEFCVKNPQLFDGAKSFRERHYSDELWKSEEARHRFVEPDLEPLR